jgi:hypothetical protein
MGLGADESRENGGVAVGIYAQSTPQIFFGVLETASRP